MVGIWQARRFDGPAGPVIVRHALHGSHLELVVESRSAAWELVADVARPASLVVRARDEGQDHAQVDALPAWAVGSRFGWSGAFVQGARVAGRMLSDDEPDGRARAVNRELELHLRSIALALHDRLAPDAVRAAQAFRPALRYWVYAAVLDDPTGRVAQLARVCPGALVLAYDHAAAHAFAGRDEHRDAAARVLADARAGLRLQRLVARAVDEWANLPGDGTEDSRAHALATATGVERDALLARQRLLLRRAGVHVRCADLARAGLPAFAPEDIPCSPLRNARWYRVTSLSALALARVRDLEVRDVLARFVSRNALLLEGWVRRRPLLRHRFGEHGLVELAARLATFCTATERRPTSQCSPLAFLDDAARWYERRTPAHHLAAFLEKVPGLGLGEVTSVRAAGDGDASFLWGVKDLPIPAVPVTGTEPGITVSPIRTPEALAAEAAAMEHCVAGLLPQLLAGEVFIYSLRIGEARLTLAAAERVHGGFEVVDLRGVRNRQASAAERLRVARWIEKLRADPASR